jgi:hypothetical protein
VCGGRKSDKHTLREMGDLLCDIGMRFFSLWYGYTANDGVLFNGALELGLELETDVAMVFLQNSKYLVTDRTRARKQVLNLQILNDRKTLNTQR